MSDKAITLDDVMADLDPLPDDDELMTQLEVAKAIRVESKTISNWIAGANPAFPRGFKLGDGARAPRVWRRRVIRAFLHCRERIAA